jgi:O-antigen/teichoic acid export membrane protein
LFYGGATVLRYAVGFFLLPIYTRILQQDQYAGMDLAIAGGALVTVVLDLQIAPAANRFYREHSDPEDRRRFLGSIAMFRLWTGSLVCAVLWYLALRYRFGYIPPLHNGMALWVLSVVSTPFALTSELLFLYVRILERRWEFCFWSLLSAVLSGLVAVVWAALTHWGAAAILAGQMLGTVVTCGVMAYLLRRDMAFGWVPPGLKRVLAYGLPLVPGAILGWCWTYLTRFYMARTLSLSDIAIFALGMKVLLFVSFAGVAFRAAFEPLSMRVLHENSESRAWYASTFNLYAAALMAMAALLSAGARPLVAILAPATYGRAAELVPLLAVSSCLTFAATSLNIGNQVACRTWNWSLATLAGVVVMGGLLWALLPLCGIVAAAIGLAAGAAVQTTVVFLTAQRAFHVPYDMSSIRTACLGIAAILLTNALVLRRIVPPLYAEAAILLSGAAAAWFILTPADRKAAYQAGLHWHFSRQAFVRVSQRAAVPEVPGDGEL